MYNRSSQVFAPWQSGGGVYNRSVLVSCPLSRWRPPYHARRRKGNRCHPKKKKKVINFFWLVTPPPDFRPGTPPPPWAVPVCPCMLYINDLPHNCPDSDIVLYADDTTCSISADNPICARQKMSLALNSMVRWFSANKLTLNTKKTVMCHFRPRGDNLIQPLQINNETIQICSNVRFLGVNVDETLSWKPHIEKLVTKLNQQRGVLRLARSRLPLHALKLIYHSLSHSALLYGLEVWGSC